MNNWRWASDADLRAATRGPVNWLRTRVGVTIMGHRQMFAQMEGWHRRRRDGYRFGERERPE